MLTPSKVIVLVLILVVVWSIFKMIEKRDNVSRDEQKSRKKTTSIDLQQCAECNSWVDAPCKEANCPIKS